MTQAVASPASDSRLTERLAELACSVRYASLSADIRQVARQCLQDWAAVSLAAIGDPVATMLLDELAAREGRPEAIAIGSAHRLPAVSAAEYNGTLAHVLDYDDVNLAITGHATAVIVPALLALAQQRGRDSASMLAAMVAGYDVACRVGLLMAPGHYARGFHSTATMGSLGAAAACAHLLGLTPQQTRVALGLAATQCGGLKAMFGSMGKPWHAGLAARNGLMAAQLAARGFEGPADIIECPQGFAEAFSPDFNLQAALAIPAGGWHIRNTLFKYHASCYATHACMEALATLQREQGWQTQDIEHVDISVHSGFATVCNIAQPRTGNEAKFSLRACAALTLAGVPTAALEAFSEQRLASPQVARLIGVSHVQFSETLPMMASGIAVTHRDGRQYVGFHDAGVPASDLLQQQRKLDAKFQALVVPVVGADHATRLHGALQEWESDGLDALLHALQACSAR